MNLHVVYSGRISPNGAVQMTQVCAEATRLKFEHLTFYICSGGGDVTSGMCIYNMLKMLDMEVTTLNFGSCGSIAATMFLAGKARISLPASSYSLHAASYVEGPLIGQISPNTSLIATPFRTELGWEEYRLNQFFGTPQESIFGPEEAIRLGVATAISDFTIPSGSTVVTVDPDRQAPVDLAVIRAAAAIPSGDAIA